MNLLFIILLSSLTMPVEAGGHKNIQQNNYQDQKSNRKNQSQQAKYFSDQAHQASKEIKTFLSFAPIAPLLLHVDVSTPEGMFYGLLLATHFTTAAAQFPPTQQARSTIISEENVSTFSLSNQTRASVTTEVNSFFPARQPMESVPLHLEITKQNKKYLRCKKLNEKKIQKTKKFLKQQKVFQNQTVTSVLVIGHDSTQAASKARDSLIEWAALETEGEKVVCVDAPDAVIKNEFLPDLDEHSKIYASIFDEKNQVKPIYDTSERLKNNWSQVDLMAQLYRANKFNLNIYGINEYMESKEQLYIGKVFGDKYFCKKITTDLEFCKQITKDVPFCQTIASKNNDETFCDKIVSITSRPRFYEENQLNRSLCMGMHSETTTTQIYHQYALDELLKNNEKNLIIIVSGFYIKNLNDYFKNKNNFNVQFINTGMILNETETERGYIGLTEREKHHICPQNSAENMLESVEFQRSVHQYHLEDCDGI